MINTQDPVFIEALKKIEPLLKSKVMTEEEILSLRSPNFYIYKNCNVRN